MTGDIQAECIAQCLRLLLPDARIEAFPRDVLSRRLAAFEHVFAQAGSGARPPRPDAILFPRIVFPGFHPDMVTVGPPERPVASPLGRPHSAIALAGFLAGRTVEETCTLYTDATFGRLGYYDFWDRGMVSLLGRAAAIGVGLEREFSLWTRRGCFMHSAVLPRIDVLGDIARRLALRAGLAPLDIAVAGYLPDGLLAGAVWPVHPAIAARYGVPATHLFKAADSGQGAPPVLMDLPRFVGASFALYRQHGRAALACPRIEAWRADAGIEALFADAGSDSLT